MCIRDSTKIIGAGYHQKFGEDHAEINAINSSTESLEGSTLFVNLEPCSHQGKTPPCVDRIIKAVSYTHLRAHETVLDLVCRLLLEKKK